jgi:hypothetical protein
VVVAAAAAAVAGGAAAAGGRGGRGFLDDMHGDDEVHLYLSTVLFFIPLFCLYFNFLF